MKYVKLFEGFLNENENHGLDYFTEKRLKTIINLKSGKEYSDEKPEALFRFFTFFAGWPTYGFHYTYLEKMKNNISAIIKEIKEYLKTGKYPELLVDMLSNWEAENIMSRGTSIEDNIKNVAKRISPDFKKIENKDNPYVIEHLNKLISILESWNTPKLLGRLNAAIALKEASLFVIKKDKIAIAPNSKIKFSKDSKITKQDSSPGSGRGDDFVRIDRTGSSNNLSITVDGKEYYVLAYDTESAYGRY